MQTKQPTKTKGKSLAKLSGYELSEYGYLLARLQKEIKCFSHIEERSSNYQKLASLIYKLEADVIKEEHRREW
jgi:hypothetical protein